MKFAPKFLWHYPAHPRHAATLHWETTHSNFLQIFSRYGRKCKQIAFVHRFKFLYTCNCVYWVYFVL